MSRPPASAANDQLHPARIRAIAPRASRVFLRRLTQALKQGAWRDQSASTLLLLSRLHFAITADIANLEQEIANKRVVLAEVAHMRRLLAGESGAMRRRPPRQAQSARSKGTNADLVVETLRRLGGTQRAATIATHLHRRHPGFGGESWRMQVYHSLAHDERIVRVSRGLYALRDDT